MHAVVPAQPELGLTPGVIFTLRNRNADAVNVNQHNRLHPYYLVYIAARATSSTTTPRSSACGNCFRAA